MVIPTISPVELQAMIEQGHTVDLVDVRTPYEFLQVRAARARNVPLEELDPHLMMNGSCPAEHATLYVICKTGQRGEKACQRFRAAGYENVVNVAGGTMAWDRAGLPVVRGNSIG
jgi:rhodanese-related sulfurtransferase